MRHTVLGHTVLGHTVLGPTVLGRTVLGCTVLGRTVFGHTVWVTLYESYHMMLTLGWGAVQCRPTAVIWDVGLRQAKTLPFLEIPPGSEVYDMKTVWELIQLPVAICTSAFAFKEEMICIFGVSTVTVKIRVTLACCWWGLQITQRFYIYYTNTRVGTVVPPSMASTWFTGHSGNAAQVVEQFTKSRSICVCILEVPVVGSNPIPLLAPFNRGENRLTTLGFWAECVWLNTAIYFSNRLGLDFDNTSNTPVHTSWPNNSLLQFFSSKLSFMYTLTSWLPPEYDMYRVGWFWSWNRDLFDHRRCVQFT